VRVNRARRFLHLLPNCGPIPRLLGPTPLVLSARLALFSPLSVVMVAAAGVVNFDDLVAAIAVTFVLLSCAPADVFFVGGTAASAVGLVDVAWLAHLFTIARSTTESKSISNNLEISFQSPNGGSNYTRVIRITSPDQRRPR